MHSHLHPFKAQNRSAHTYTPAQLTHTHTTHVSANAFCRKNQGPLHYAAQSGKAQVIKVLFENATVAQKDVDECIDQVRTSLCVLCVCVCRVCVCVCV